MRKNELLAQKDDSFENLAMVYLITTAHAEVQIYVEVNATYPPFR